MKISYQYIFELLVVRWVTRSRDIWYLILALSKCTDWTSQFAKRLGCRFGDVDEKGMLVAKDLPWVMIDGPYGSAAVDVFDYEVSVLVGAGIGVTPFASVLKEIWYRVHEPSAHVRLRKVYFIWICRDKEVSCALYTRSSMVVFCTRVNLRLSLTGLWVVPRCAGNAWRRKSWWFSWNPFLFNRRYAV